MFFVLCWIGMCAYCVFVNCCTILFFVLEFEFRWLFFFFVLCSSVSVSLVVLLLCCWACFYDWMFWGSSSLSCVVVLCSSFWFWFLFLSLCFVFDWYLIFIVVRVVCLLPFLQSCSLFFILDLLCVSFLCYWFCSLLLKLFEGLNC